MKFSLIISILFVLCSFSCQQSKKKFQLLSPKRTGVNFNNAIPESDSINVLTSQYLYNGGGVGIADFNNDGLQDIYFTGNYESNRLYLNKGDFKFDDVTSESNSACKDIWSSGVSIVDINADGWMDIYLSACFYEDSLKRVNQLLINQGNDQNGIPSFKEEAKAFGLDDNGYTTHTVFLDYDLDGDLDAFMLNNKLLLRRSASFQNRVTDGSSITTDRLYRNEGNQRFKNVSIEAGITYEGFGLGVSVVDVNMDGYPDIYVSNDFVTNDVLYVNKRDGSFSNEINQYISHQSFSAMGIDAGDINNDGLDEIMTLDMLPEDDQRFKRMYGENQFQYFDIMENSGYELQYFRNSLQLNNGNQSYSEISQMLGLDATDWSWSILFADFDNDMNADIAISNGFPRDITDLDFINYRSGANRMLSINKAMLNQVPQVKIKNYFFKNNGNLQFENVSSEWGINEQSFSNGAAYGDLDNDGDLDYVVNNINDPAFVFRNTTPPANYIRIALKSNTLNLNSIGARVTLMTEGIMQSKTLNPYRGYISSVEPILHFGLSTIETVDSIIVIWPDQSKQVLTNIMANQELKIEKNTPKNTLRIDPIDGSSATLLSEKTSEYNLEFKHTDKLFFDFNLQPLLPHTHSSEGPGTAVGDINGDGTEDVIFANGRSNSLSIHLQIDGNFIPANIDDESESEDIGLTLFDADNDLDLDLYVCSGSSEFMNGTDAYLDRLFINDGKGNFTLENTRLPQITSSTSSAYACDFDKDGDQDLFVGGRIDPQYYPMPVSSFILLNDEGTFVEGNALVCPELNDIGMVTSALWTDFDNDNWMDLILVGEWMPITIFKNNQGKFQNVTKTFHLEKTKGWWNTISGADLNKDGNIDYIIGNQGLNNRNNPSESEPIRIVAKDFDENGAIDNFMFGYRDGKLVPLHLLKDIRSQLNKMRKKYQRFEDYAQSDFGEFLSNENLEGSYQNEVYMFESIILMNYGNSFEIKKLPIQAQISPIYGIATEDINFDGILDILVVGNKFGTERISGKHDASVGLLMLGDGNQNYLAIPPAKSGFFVNGDAKSLVKLETDHNQIGFIAARNNDTAKLFELNKKDRNQLLISPPPHCQYYLLHHQNGQIEKREVYYGSGYASTSTNRFSRYKDVVKIEFFDQNGTLIKNGSNSQ